MSTSPSARRDHGRAVGYEIANNIAHGHHHRHCMGRVEPVDFISFEAIEARFEQDWLAVGGRT
jgi:hypothetical protein